MYKNASILADASSALVYNPNNTFNLGAVESIVNKTDMLVNCYENVFNAVNYNAKCDIKNPCYSYTFIAKVINTYRQLVVNGVIQPYDREFDIDEIANIENEVINATQEDSGRVKAVLYELYYSVQRNESKKECLDPTLNSSVSWLVYASIIAASIGGGYFIYRKRNKRRR
jgi:polyribonucleotide nucleotidyltransferase